MKGHSVKLPITNDKLEGAYSMNRTVEESIKQNFKMLLLTNPGERIMNPDYGVGLRQILFEQDAVNVKSLIISRINEQVKKYLNVISVGQISFSDGLEDDYTNSNNNVLVVKIYFSIPFLGLKDELNLEFSPN